MQYVWGGGLWAREVIKATFTQTPGFMYFLALNISQLASILNLDIWYCIFWDPSRRSMCDLRLCRNPVSCIKPIQWRVAHTCLARGTPRSAPRSAWRDSCAQPLFLRRWFPTINRRAKLREVLTIDIGPICNKGEKILDDKWRWSMASYLTDESLQVSGESWVSSLNQSCISHAAAIALRNPKALQPGICLSSLAFHFSEKHSLGHSNLQFTLGI